MQFAQTVETPQSIKSTELKLDLSKLDSVKEFDERSKRNHKMTLMETSLALVATNIGGGILGFPYAFYHLGITLAVIMTLVLAVNNHMSSMMYLKTKDLTPRKLESVYEIAFLLFGRASIFVVCIIMFLSNYGAIVLFYMIIGETTSTLFTQAIVLPEEDTAEALGDFVWYEKMATTKTFGILLAGLAHFSVIFKR